MPPKASNAPITRAAAKGWTREPTSTKARGEPFFDVAEQDYYVKKGGKLPRDTLRMLHPGESGRLIDWEATNEKIRKLLHHPLSKEFDSM